MSTYLWLVDQERNALHQVTDEDEVAAHRDVERKDVASVAALVCQLVRVVIHASFPAVQDDLVIHASKQLAVEGVEVIDCALRRLLSLRAITSESRCNATQPGCHIRTVR